MRFLYFVLLISTALPASGKVEKILRPSEAQGKPGEAVMQRLTEVGARLGELRHKASMGAFRDVERGEAGAEPEAVKAAIGAGAAQPGPVAFGGLGF